MKICRFVSTLDHEPRIGLLMNETHLKDLTAAGIASLTALLEEEASSWEGRVQVAAPLIPLEEVKLLPPVERQEIWAAGVTYLRSKKARMEESDFSASAYDRVYEAERPELFFKALPDKVVGPGEAVGIRKDARWNVPEPELALMINSRGAIVGYTIGNDMSSRDIEGENLLYLPQAKIYNRSCALGPWIACGLPESEARCWEIALSVQRGRETVFEGETNVSNIKRSFSELRDYLFRSQSFPAGVVLLTGTGIIPLDAFSLLAGDIVRIAISGIGELENQVVEV
jgi:2-dehydro-3-deoxy-D-arabinonate dehydratase